MAAECSVALLTLYVENDAGPFGSDQSRMASFASVVGVVVVWLRSDGQLGSRIEPARHVSIGGRVLHPSCNVQTREDTLVRQSTVAQKGKKGEK